MKEFNVPGIYITKEKIHEPLVDPLGPKPTGFAGITEKGPLNTPVLIRSFGEFQRIFGDFTDFSYLPFSIYGFFQTGGTECYVVRIGHESKNNVDSGLKSSELILNSLDNKESCSIYSKTQGSWGNEIHCRLWYVEGFSTIVSKNIKEKNNIIELDNEHEFSVGDSIKLNCSSNEIFKIDNIDGNKIRLNKAIKKNLNPQKIFISEVLINLEFSYKKYFESFYYLSPNDSRKNYILNKLNKSQLIGFDHTNNECPVEYNGFLAGGSDGLLSLTPGDFIGYYNGLQDYKGIGCFESKEEIGLISCPDTSLFYTIFNNKTDANKAIYSVHNAMITQCEKNLNRFAIFDIDGEDLQQIINISNKYDCKNAALYYPRLKIVHPADILGLETINIPPSGHLAGLYTHCDKSVGLFKAPANIYLLGAVGLSRDVDDEEYSIAYENGINSFKVIPGRGVKPWGVKTTSSDIEWKYINVRRTFSGIQQAIKNSASWAVFEINDKRLRKRVIRFVTAFLLELWRDGYLKGHTPEEAFFVKCDNENNSQSTIDNGLLQVDIGISITKPAEYMNIKMLGNSENAAVTLIDEN